ncbi:hypothetical protein, partial [Methyloglobulus sp.]|uniref:hypothetical protein n=1 Tax=Methyloglobulus sp. TaxID=2518622 RepID=UPI0039899F6B
LTGEVVNGDQQALAGLGWGLALKQRQPLGVEMDRLARIGLVVAPGLPFQAPLDGLFDLGGRLRPYWIVLKRWLVLSRGVNSRSLARLRTDGFKVEV